LTTFKIKQLSDTFNDTSRNVENGTVKSFLLTNDTKSKSDEDYGKRIAQYINGVVRGTNSYFFARNARFRKNRLLANGRLDIQRMFKDRMEFNGKQNYANLSWKAPAIVSTTISRQVGSWMRRAEKIEVTATDYSSLMSKKEAADITEFIFDYKDTLGQLEQEAGVPIVPQGQFVAEDKDELDAWTSEFNRLPEEIKYEIGVNNILAANGWTGVNKEKTLQDSAEVGLVATYTYMDENGQIHVEWIKPENAVYSYSEYPDFRDTAWRGHVFSLKISELRAKYGKEFGGKLTEEDIFKIAATAKEYQVFDKLTWINDWNFMFVRPYDEWNVDCLRFEIKTVDSDKYTVTKTKLTGSTVINKGLPKTASGKIREKLLDNQEVIEDKKWNIYEGVYVINTSTILSWGIKKNMIRPQDPKELGDAEFSYSFYMYKSYDMRNLAIPEKIEEPVEQMILARLKIQQLVAKMKPAGAAVNVDALQELDLGLATMVKPLEVQKIWEQTGNLYYRGRDAEGNAIPMPISELANSGFAPQLQQLIELYRFHYQVLKDELGNDPSLFQSAATPRVTEGNIQASMQLADDSTDYMYDAFTYLMEETSKKVACLLNKSVSFEAKAYRDLLKQDEVKNRNFQTKFKLLPTGQQIAELKNMLNIAVQSNPQVAVFIDQFKILRIAKEDVKLAELYYRQGMKRMMKAQQETAAKNSEQNAQIQQASMQAKAEGDSQLEDKKNQAKERQIVMQGIIDLAKANIPMPEELKALAADLVKSVAIPVAMETQQMEQAMQQQAQQQGGQEQQLAQQIAQMLQQGAAPEEVMQKLVEMGMPEEQAQQAIQMVMQQMQGGEQQPEQGQEMPSSEEQGQEMPQEQMEQQQ
jgi:hypothetical protein